MRRKQKVLIGVTLTKVMQDFFVLFSVMLSLCSPGRPGTTISKNLNY